MGGGRSRWPPPQVPPEWGASHPKHRRLPIVRVPPLRASFKRVAITWHLGKGGREPELAAYPSASSSRVVICSLGLLPPV